MLFNSYIFLFLFLPAVMCVYYLTPEKNRNLTLTLASYVFYGYWNLNFCSLIMASTLWNYWLGNKIYLAGDQNSKKHYLVLVIGLNLGLLGVFKYADFFIGSLAHLLPFLSVYALKVILPIGISFYTFQGMSYGFDVYNGKSRPVSGFIDFACYIAMFPQLIAGPIVRYHQIAGQLVQRSYTTGMLAGGLRRFIIGLSKKVLLADTLAAIADQQLSGGGDGWSIWIGLMAFSLQIYFDFSGYSDMAIGLGRLLGFNLPENFNFPYQAKGLYEFWRRWHMTLSGWLKDYLYIPLGGGRCSAKRWAFNLLLTFLLCGLWHGAAWTFVVWGGYHGLLLIIEKPFRSKIERLPAWVAVPGTYFCVLIGWTFFRAEGLGQAFGWLATMFGLADTAGISMPPVMLIALLVMLQMLCWMGAPKAAFWKAGGMASDAVLAALLLMSFVAILGVAGSPFLYYQF